MKYSNYNSLVLAFYILIILMSCGQKGVDNIASWDYSFGEVKKLVSAPCLDEELILGRPFLIHYADSSLLIYDDIGDSLFILLDLNDNNKIYRFGKKGEGSDEFLQVFDICNMKSYSVLGFYENNMLSLTGNVVGRKFFFEYPYKDGHEKKISNRLRGMAYQGTLCSNKSLGNFLYAVRSAPIFILYSVEKDRIQKTYEWIGGYPIYETEENETWRSAPMSADNKMAFVMAYATDSYVYLLYSGKSIKEAGTDAFKANIIYRLSWDGKPNCKFELDYSLTNFCVSDYDDILYGLADKGEIELVQYVLK